MPLSELTAQLDSTKSENDAMNRDTTSPRATFSGGVRDTQSIEEQLADLELSGVGQNDIPFSLRSNLLAVLLRAYLSTTRTQREVASSQELPPVMLRLMQTVINFAEDTLPTTSLADDDDVQMATEAFGTAIPCLIQLFKYHFVQDGSYDDAQTISRLADALRSIIETGMQRLPLASARQLLILLKEKKPDEFAREANLPTGAVGMRDSNEGADDGADDGAISDRRVSQMIGLSGTAITALSAMAVGAETKKKKEEPRTHPQERLDAFLHTAFAGDFAGLEQLGSTQLGDAGTQLSEELVSTFLTVRQGGKFYRASEYKQNLVRMLQSENAEKSTLELPSLSNDDATVGTVTLLRVLAATILGTGEAIKHAVEGVSFVHDEAERDVENELDEDDVREKQLDLMRMGGCEVAIRFAMSESVDLSRGGIELAIALLYNGNTIVQDEILRLLKAFGDTNGGLLATLKNRLRLGIKEIRERKIFQEQKEERRHHFEETQQYEGLSAATLRTIQQARLRLPSQ